MHSVTVRQEIVDRVLKRRGRYHLFDRLDPARTALVVIDMQTAFCAPGGPAEVPGSRDIVPPINILTAELRALGVPVFWVLHANSRIGGKSDWELFFNMIVADEVREKTLLRVEASVARGIPIHSVLREGISGDRITTLYGILNGTCNYILTEIEKRGASFEEVLAEAQAAGYGAEADQRGRCVFTKTSRLPPENRCPCRPAARAASRSLGLSPIRMLLSALTGKRSSRSVIIPGPGLRRSFARR